MYIIDMVFPMVRSTPATLNTEVDIFSILNDPQTSGDAVTARPDITIFNASQDTNGLSICCIMLWPLILLHVVCLSVSYELDDDFVH